ncbi:MAG: histidine phosphatase family protein [Desulfopila sp.]
MLNSSLNPTITYGLLRHGETVWNREKRVQGHGDSPLTEAGKKALAAWAKVLDSSRWSHILASDLGRVRQTVAIINQEMQLPVTVEPRLREQNWGDWEQMKVSEVFAQYAEFLAINEAKGWDFRPPNGESRREVLARGLAALADFRTDHARGDILVVCHLGLIKCFLYHAAGCSFLPDANIRFEKSCLHHLLYADGGYQLGQLDIRPQDLAP